MTAAKWSVSIPSQLQSLATGCRRRTHPVSTLSCKIYLPVLSKKDMIKTFSWKSKFIKVSRVKNMGSSLSFCLFSTQIWDNRRGSLQPLETRLGIWKDQGARVSMPPYLSLFPVSRSYWFLCTWSCWGIPQACFNHYPPCVFFTGMHAEQGRLLSKLPLLLPLLQLPAHREHPSSL